MAPQGSARRAAITRERVLAAAIALADRAGIEALTIRALAAELGVKPMTIYHYVEGKEVVLDGMVDVLFSEFELPAAGLDWREAVRRRCVSARDVLVRHPWSVPLLETRTSPGEATLRHHEAMLGYFFDAGFSLSLTAHAYAVLDSYVYGFALQEATVPVEGAAGDDDTTRKIAAQFAPEEYPHLVRFATDHVMQPGYRFGDSFEYGLDLFLDGIAAARDAER
jgi:AcrR family transcriptional regulator